MMKKIISLCLAITCLFGCSNTTSSQEKYSDSFMGPFNTLFTVIMYEETETQFDENFSLIQTEFEYYNQLFDKYNDYEGVNNVRTINDNAGIEPVKVEEDLFNLIKTAIEYNQTICNKVNIAMGAVLSIWHDYRELDDGSVPTIDELTLANEHTDINQVILDEEALTVYLADSEMSLDVGSIAKGYACELVKQKLIEKGLDDFLISAGGNVISYGKRGVKASETSLSDALPSALDYYTVTVQSPKTGEVYENVSDIMAVTLQHNESMVTSGDYERYFVGNDGVTYHHLIDPDTLYPAYNVRSVTVITEDSGLADFLSTSLFLMDEEEGLALINSLDEDVEVVWLTNDGRILYTSGLVEGENCTTSW